MPLSSRLTKLATIAAAFLLPATASSQGEAIKARLAWSAFECSVIAGFAGNADLANDLFDFGYRNSMEFLSAAQAGKISPEEAQTTIPIGFSLKMQGPNAEFITGRVYETILSERSNKIFEGEQYALNEELRTSRARRMLLEQNCEILIR